eukprot:PhM_4_TR5108/c0_g1_i1/m.83675
MLSTYRSACREFRCPENSGLCRLFGELDAQADAPTSLDLSTNYCGPENGFAAVLEVVKTTPCLSELNLSGNYLTTENVRALVAVLLSHPRVSVVRLNDNRLYIESGKELVRLARYNPRIVCVETEGGCLPQGHSFKNKIPQKLVSSIEQHVQYNVAHRGLSDQTR